MVRLLPVLSAAEVVREVKGAMPTGSVFAHAHDAGRSLVFYQTR
jgi:hypothetical protein